jgi:hypothetical protein
MASLFTTNDYCVTDCSFAYGAISVSTPDAYMEAFVEENWFTQENVAFSNSGPFRRLFYVKSGTTFDYTTYNTQAIGNELNLSDLFVHDTELISALEVVDGTFYTQFNNQFNLSSCLNNNTLTFRLTNTLYGRNYRLYLRFNQVNTTNISTIIASYSGEIRMLVKVTFSSFALVNQLKYDAALKQANATLLTVIHQKKTAAKDYDDKRQKNVTCKVALLAATSADQNAATNVSDALDKVNAATEVLTLLSNDTTTAAYSKALIAQTNAQTTYTAAITLKTKTALDLSKATTDYANSNAQVTASLNALDNAIANVSNASSALTVASNALIVPTQNYIRASTDPYMTRRYLSERVSTTTTQFNKSLTYFDQITLYLKNSSDKNRAPNLDILLEKPTALEALTNVSVEHQVILQAVAKESIGDYSAVTQLLLDFVPIHIETQRIAAIKRATSLNTTLSFNQMNLYAEQKIKNQILLEKKNEYNAAQAEEVLANASYEEALAQEIAVDTSANQTVIAEKQTVYDQYSAEADNANASYAAAQTELANATEEVAAAETEVFKAEGEANAAKTEADSLVNFANDDAELSIALVSLDFAKKKTQTAKEKNDLLLEKKKKLNNAKLQSDTLKLIADQKNNNQVEALTKLKDSTNKINLPKANTQASLAKKKSAKKKKESKDLDFELYYNENTLLEDSVSSGDSQQVITTMTTNNANVQAGGAVANLLLNADQLTVNDVKQFLTDYADSDTSGDSANSALNNMLSGDILGSLTNIYDLVRNYDPAAAALKAAMEMEAAIKRGDAAEAAKIAAKAALVMLMVAALSDAIAAADAAKDIADKLNQNPPDYAGAAIVATKFIARRLLAKIEVVQFMAGFTTVLVLAALDPLNKSIQAGLEAAKNDFNKYSNLAISKANQVGANLLESNEFKKSSEIAAEIANFANTYAAEIASFGNTYGSEIANFAEDVYSLGKNYNSQSDSIAIIAAEQALREGNPTKAAEILAKAKLVRIMADLIQDEVATKKAEEESSVELNKTPPNLIGASVIMANLVADRSIARIKTAETIVTFGTVLVGPEAAPATKAFEDGFAITEAGFNQITSDIQTGIVDVNNRLPIPMNLSPDPQSQIENLNTLSNAALAQLNLDHNVNATTVGINNLITDTNQLFTTIDTKSAQIAQDAIDAAAKAADDARRLAESIGSDIRGAFGF